MYRQLLESSSLLTLPIFGLIIFLSVFVIIVIHAFHSKNLEKHNQIARLPFEHDKVPHE